MKLVIWLLIIILLISAGYMVMDYLGYYIEWKVSAISLVILFPVIQAVRNFLNRPEKIFKKDNDSGPLG